MKPLFDKPLHLIVIVILLVVSGFYFYAGRQQERFDTDAVAYLRQALADIGSWQPQVLRRQLANEASAAVTDAQLDALMRRYRALGAFKTLEDPQFARLTAALSLFHREPLLSYSGLARFQHGSAQITATLVLHDGRFQLYNFNLGPPQWDNTDNGGTPDAG